MSGIGNLASLRKQLRVRSPRGSVRVRDAQDESASELRRARLDQPVRVLEFAHDANFDELGLLGDDVLHRFRPVAFHRIASLFR